MGLTFYITKDTGLEGESILYLLSGIFKTLPLTSDLEPLTCFYRWCESCIFTGVSQIQKVSYPTLGLVCSGTLRGPGSQASQ
jgi:hypothetical protein